MLGVAPLTESLPSPLDPPPPFSDIHLFPPLSLTPHPSVLPPCISLALPPPLPSAIDMTNDLSCRTDWWAIINPALIGLWRQEMELSRINYNIPIWVEDVETFSFLNDTINVLYASKVSYANVQLLTCFIFMKKFVPLLSRAIELLLFRRQSIYLKGSKLGSTKHVVKHIANILQWWNAFLI